MTDCLNKGKGNEAKKKKNKNPRFWNSLCTFDTIQIKCRNSFKKYFQ